MQKHASLSIKYLFTEFPRDQRLECRHMIFGGGEEKNILQCDAHLIGLCRQGAGILMSSGRVDFFSAGNLILIPAGNVFSIQSAPETDSRWDLALVGEEEIPATRAGMMVIQNALAAGTMGLLMEEWYQGKPFARQAQQLLLSLLWLQLQRSGIEERGNGASLSLHQQRAVESVHPALVRMGANCGEKITVQQLAALCHLSPAQFQRVFLKATGQSPHAYLIFLRMKLAASLLKATDQPVAGISEQVGFESITSFNRHFQKYFSMSPRAYRLASRNPSQPAKQALRGEGLQPSAESEICGST